EVGTMIGLPPPTVGGPAAGAVATAAVAATPVTLQPSAGGSFSAEPGTKVLIEDVNGNGAVGVVDGATSMHLVDPVPVLMPPLRTLFNLLAVSRGKTVTHEVLGSGNALVAGQDFVLQNAPVTYLQGPDSKSGDNYS